MVERERFICAGSGIFEFQNEIDKCRDGRELYGRFGLNEVSYLYFWSFD